MNSNVKKIPFQKNSRKLPAKINVLSESNTHINKEIYLGIKNLVVLITKSF